MSLNGGWTKQLGHWTAKLVRSHLNIWTKKRSDLDAGREHCEAHVVILDMPKAIHGGWFVILLKSFPYAFSDYFLFFPKASSNIVSQLEFIFKKFLWRGDERSRRVNWVRWDTVCRDPEEDGLLIKNLKVFNLALLGKWLWRMKYGVSKVLDGGAGADTYGGRMFFVDEECGGSRENGCQILWG